MFHYGQARQHIFKKKIEVKSNSFLSLVLHFLHFFLTNIFFLFFHFQNIKFTKNAERVCHWEWHHNLPAWLDVWQPHNCLRPLFVLQTALRRLACEIHIGLVLKSDFFSFLDVLQSGYF